MSGDKIGDFILLFATLIDGTMSDEPAQNGTVPDDVETEETPKPRSGEEAKAARSMDAMQTNKEPTTAADVDDAKLANVRERSGRS
jgi:hypothetical protein